MVVTHFRQYGKIIFMLLCLSLLQGCASRTSKENGVACGLAGVLIGAAASVAADDSDSDTEGSAAVGAATGGLVGALICSNIGGKEAVAATPRKRKVRKSVRRAASNGDSDGDGVPDSDDICPDTDKKYDVDKLGCPILLDRDHDGVPDEQDRCPDTPRGSAVNHEGCPLVGEKMILLENIHFAFNQFSLTAAANGILNRLAQTMKERTSLRVSIEGHTDNVGTDDYNNHLSRMRALAALTYLTKRGVDKDQLSILGHGESKATADNDTEQGRAKNRRVEFIVLKQ